MTDYTQFLVVGTKLFNDSAELATVLRRMADDIGHNKSLANADAYYLVACASHIETMYQHLVSVTKALTETRGQQ